MINAKAFEIAAALIKRALESEVEQIYVLNEDSDSWEGDLHIINDAGVASYFLGEEPITAEEMLLAISENLKKGPAA